MSEEVKIYIRNSQKAGKILHLHPKITGNELYDKASASHNLEVSAISLILQGKMVKPEDELTLVQKAIVHLITLGNVQKETITVKVRQLAGNTEVKSFEVDANSKISALLEDKLSKDYEQDADKLFLVHIGRQLHKDSSFQSELIEDGSELICVDTEAIKKEKGDNEVIKVAVKDMEVSGEPKDLDPQENFRLKKHEQVNATSDIDLVFDPNAKTHHSNIEMKPESVIKEENGEAEEAKEEANEEAQKVE